MVSQSFLPCHFRLQNHLESHGVVEEEGEEEEEEEEGKESNVEDEKEPEIAKKKLNRKIRMETMNEWTSKVDRIWYGKNAD